MSAHYEQHWGKPLASMRSKRDIEGRLDPTFAVEVRHPSKRRAVWTYSTVGMSADRCRGAIEAHLVSRIQCDEASVFRLTVLAYFHLTGEKLGLEHTVDFGAPWLPGSELDHGYLSLPYLDGPELEWQRGADGDVQHLWLIPITRAERALKRERGAEALEQLFERAPLAYDDPFRASLC